MINVKETKEKILEALGNDEKKCVICGENADVECENADGSYAGFMCNGCSSRHLINEFG